MTVTLTYDPTLSRVRLSADGLGAASYATVERSTDQTFWSIVRGGVQAPITQRADFRHTFSAVASNGWGTPDTGQTLTLNGGSAANYSANGTVGIISVATLNVERVVDLGVSLADVEVRGEVQSPVTPTGAGFEIKIIGRYVDGNNFVDGRLFLGTDANVTCAVRQFVGAVETVSSFPTVAGVTATSLIAYALQASGNLLRFKAWLSGTPEPAAWTVSMTTTHTTAGAVRVGNFLPSTVSNTLPVNITYDNLVVGPRVVAVDDYEFVSGKQNFYRVRGVESSPITFVGAGAAATGNNASLVPAHPTGLANGLQPGDLKVIDASIRNSGTGTVNVPAGWTLMRAFGNAAFLGKFHVAGDTAPTVTFANGVANADTLAQMGVWRGADLTPVTGADQLNASAQNVAYPALTIPLDNLLILLAAWKQDDVTSVDTLALTGAAEVGEASSIAGDDASQAWDWLIQTGKANIAAGSFVFNGGAAAISRGAVVALQHAAFLNEQTASTTPVLDRIWLKSVTRPFLNRPITVVDWSPEERPARGAGYPAVGRTLEVAVVDVAGGLQFDLNVHCPTQQDAQTLDYVRASGDILFLHTPAGCPVPGGHMCLDTSSARRPRPRGASRVFTLPLRQCAPPGPDVVGATSTWQTVLDSYPSWPALLAANATWADLLARIAPPSEVVVS